MTRLPEERSERLSNNAIREIMKAILVMTRSIDDDGQRAEEAMKLVNFMFGYALKVVKTAKGFSYEEAVKFLSENLVDNALKSKERRLILEAGLDQIFYDALARKLQ